MSAFEREPGVWSVEKIDDDGGIEQAIFIGPGAERRCRKYASLSAENERLREVLNNIKGMICGGKIPFWSDESRVTDSRAVIADLCDEALAAHVGEGDKEAEMNNDIEYGGLLSAHDKISKAQSQQESIETLRAERDSLHKALDDRYAADLKAAKAIFAETGRTSGFPSVKEVVAWYVAEVERLRKALEDAQRAAQLAERREDTSRKFWIRDAKEAIAGKPQALRNRVELFESPENEMRVVLSGEALAAHVGEKDGLE